MVTLALAKSIHVPLTLRLTFITTFIREMVSAAKLDLAPLKIRTILAEMWTGIAAWLMVIVFILLRI